MRAQLQQDIREQIRLEYEDLIASYQHNQQQHAEDAHDADDDDEEQEQQGMDKQDALEHEYDTRLENEKKQIEEYYEGKQTELNAQLHDVKDNNTKLQQQCASMQSHINSMQNEIDSLKQ